MNELRCLRAIDRGDVTLIKQLIGTGHDFNGGVGQRKMPPVIYHAVEKNFTEAVEMLVSAGVNVNVKYTPELKSPLYLSAYIGNEVITEILCRNGANVNEVNLKGETPVFPAIEWTALSKNMKVIQTLLSFGADVNVMSTNGSTPLIKAIECDYLPVIQILIEKGAKLDLIHYKEMKCALKHNNNQIIDYLLRHYRKESDQTMRSNISAVDLCLQYFNLKAMRLSIELGFKVSDQLFDNPLVLLKTILQNNHQNICDAEYCFDYLMIFSHLFDFNQTFAFKYELPNNTKIISGNLLTYALLFNCSYMSKRLIQIGVSIENSIFNYYRFDYNDCESLKLLYLSGIQFPNNFCTKCYPNTYCNSDPNYKLINKNEFKEFCLWIKNKSSQTYSLQQMVRIHLRNRFGTNLSKIVTNLKIPHRLVSYILFEF